MTDQNATVVRHLQNARDALSALAARREALQALSDQWAANVAQDAAGEPTPTLTEAEQ